MLSIAQTMTHLADTCKGTTTLENVLLRPPRWLFCGILLALLPIGCGRTPAEPEKTPPAPVKWMEARQLFVEEWTELIGTTQPLPDRAARVSAAIEGHVVSVLKDAAGKHLAEGQLVKKGDVLVQLYDQIARAGRDKSQADLAELEQGVQQAVLGITSAEIELRRLEELDKKSVPGNPPLVAPVELEKARIGLEEAKSKRRGAELRVEAAKKQLKMLEEQLKLYALTAPISGRLGRVLVVQGQTLSVGAPVAEILDIDEQIDILCFVPPHVARKLIPPDIAKKLKKDEQQVVRIQAVENQPQGQMQKSEGEEPALAGAKKQPNPEGSIVYVADQSEVDTGNFAVKARFTNVGRRLRNNVTVRALVRTTPGKACLTLPESALMEDQDPPAVIVVEDHQVEKTKEGKEIETGKARKLQVKKVGIRDHVLHLVEIIELEDPEKKWQGTLETAKFVVEKGQGLRTGDPIKLEVEEEEEAPAAPEKKES
jgi:multidrug efflux pump subunit AcrA (membrane-fusion protein)